MKVYKEINLSNFEFYSGARYLANMLTYQEFDTIEEWLECGSDMHEATAINDFFWFDRDMIVAEILGYPDVEGFYSERSEK